MQGVAQPKRSVSIDITKHIKTFIDPYNGQEITREQLRDMSRGIYKSAPSEVSESVESVEDGGGGEVKEEGEQI